MTPFPLREEFFNTSIEYVKAVIYETQIKDDFAKELILKFEKMSRKRSEIDILPLIIYSIFHTDILNAVPLMTTWQLLRYAAKCFDDAEDEAINSPRLINIGSAFLFMAQQVLWKLRDSGKNEDVIYSLCLHFNQSSLSACAGQHLDLSGQAGYLRVDPDTWMEIALSKSGDLFAWAVWSGAFLAGVEEKDLKSYYDFGQYLGALLQAHDDFEDVWGTDKVGDIENYRVSLPYVYAFHVAPPIKQQNLTGFLRNSEKDTELSQQIRELLVALGSQKFILAVMFDLRQKALGALKNTGHFHSGQFKPLTDLLDQLCPRLTRSE